jgi:hypothetical protein
LGASRHPGAWPFRGVGAFRGRTKQQEEHSGAQAGATQ